MTWTLHPISAYSAQHAAWDALQARSLGLPFLESHFLQPLIEVFGSGKEQLAICEQRGDWVAAALLRPADRGRWELFLPSQLPLGAWIGAAPAEQLDTLLRLLPGLPLALGTPQLDSRFYAQGVGARQRETAYIDTAWVEVQGSFDAYWEARGKNLRQNTRKQRSKLAADGIVTRMDCVSEPAAMAEALAQYGRLEAAGWKAADGTHIHPENDQGRFYRAMLEGFATYGRARVYRYWFGEQVVAMDLCITAGRQIVILKTAYDEAHSKLSPSTLMRQEQFEQLFAEGLWDRIEFYGKLLEWHTRWTELRRPIYHRTAYRWAWLLELQRWREARRARLAAPPTEQVAATNSPPSTG
jgi:hypothetical protein